MGGKVHSIAEAHYHAQWTLKTIDYDIGVIKVSSPFVWSSRVRPVTIPKTSEEDFLDFSRNATVSGWGLTSQDAWSTACYLKTVDIPLVPRQKCAQIHEQVPHAPKVTPRMLCAAGTGLGGPCSVS